MNKQKDLLINPTISKRELLDCIESTQESLDNLNFEAYALERLLEVYYKDLEEGNYYE